ncbi:MULTISPECIES: NADPH-dependent FMN reductase [Ferrimonas]|uniref:NADPH-dependent FMN reductase n=1 Tax=Ferrimonas TaxID=44011 RepID=UPI0004181F8E|nr:MULTISPECIES: NAD(P)H-dependent oxidoreductase [Ferrimonas]USD36095.1 NAD(P)H-dependent oxidoreductase [Ferrimonas sp. SCSIO 43195]
MKVVAFGASNSKASINKKLATYAASMVEGAQVEVLDLNDYPLPLFGEDKEAEIGQPQPAKSFVDKLGSADAIVVSLAEHNGSYTAAYKNLFDWASRINREVFQQKPVIYLATSPGPGGAASVLASAVGSAQFFGADVKGSLSIPSFYDNFDLEAGVLKSEVIQQQLAQTMSTLFTAE